MKRIFVLLALAALPLVLLACGEDDPAPTEVATAEGGTETAQPATQGTPAAETPIPPPSETVTSTYSTPTSELPLVRFETDDGGVELPVEVPPRDEYPIGLSGRTTLEGRGMVFHREDFGQTGFWMKNTHIDLDIAFVDEDDEIIYITTMIADTETLHRPDSPYVAAIEAPAGWYEEHGVEVGDTVTYLFDLEATIPE